VRFVNMEQRKDGIQKGYNAIIGRKKGYSAKMQPKFIFTVIPSTIRNSYSQLTKSKTSIHKSYAK